MKPAAFAIAALSLVAVATDSALAEGDVAAGEKAFIGCKSCHAVGEGARNRVGPQLNNVMGRPAGSAEGARYSPLMTSAKEAGLVWTPELVAQYVQDPSGFLTGYVNENGGAAKGRSTMSFKLPEAKAADVAAYVATFSE